MTMLQRMLSPEVNVIELRKRRELSPGFHKLSDKMRQLSKDGLENLIKLLEEKIGENT
jgi:hypothetical protein